MRTKTIHDLQGCHILFQGLTKNPIAKICSFFKTTRIYFLCNFHNIENICFRNYPHEFNHSITISRDISPPILYSNYYNIVLNKMNEKHKRNKTMAQQRESNKFSVLSYKSSQNPEQYIGKLIYRVVKEDKKNGEAMNIQELSQTIKNIGLILKTKQLHELYLYATYQQQSKTDRKKALSMVNLESNKINMHAVTRWLHRKLLKNSILIEQIENEKKNKKRLEKRIQTQSCQIKGKPEPKLPQIKIRPNYIFTTEIGKVLGIFSEMEKQRQYAGLEPMCISSDQEEDHGEPIKQIHYQGSFFQVNKKLLKMRDEARKGIQKVIDATKHDKKLKQKFQQALMRYQRVRTQANQKMGKCGAMKAQKRMMQKRKEDIKAIDQWRQNTNQTQFSSKFY